MATVLAGPGVARYLADFGADVVKVESPAGDGTRRMGWVDPRDGESFMWKLLGRGKRAAVLDLKTEAGLDTMRRLVDSADVLIENFRPGTLERLGLDPVELLERNPGLVILRVTGFGQDGPYAGRPGFATMAEAMSGFAAINGEPDGAPLLPPIALTDEVTALAGAFTVMVALRHRDRTGEGQVVDINLLETMLQLMGALPERERAPRLPAAAARQRDPLHRAPRHLPVRGRALDRDLHVRRVDRRPRDGAARRRRRPPVRDVRGPGRAPGGAGPDRGRLGRAPGPPRTSSPPSRQAHAAIAPVYSMADLLADPHIAAREAIVEVDGVRMPGLLARFSKTPGAVRHAGRALGCRHRRGPRGPLGRARTGPDARRPEECRSRDPPSRAGPQRLLGTSLSGILHHVPWVFQSHLWTTLWTASRILGRTRAGRACRFVHLPPVTREFGRRQESPGTPESLWKS